MVIRLTIVDDPDEEDRDEEAAGVEVRERAANIMGPERRQLIIELARGTRRIVDLARDHERPPQVISNFKYRNKREIIQMRRVMDSKTADMHFAAQVHRIGDAERHLAFLDDQIRQILDNGAEGEPIDTKELRGLVMDASKLRKEIREELKPTMSIGEIKFTPPKRYGGQNWFETEEEEGSET
jgi:hypothetical protein